MSPVMPFRRGWQHMSSVLRYLLVERDWPIVRTAWVLCLALLLCLNRAGLALVLLLVGHVADSTDQLRPQGGGFSKEVSDGTRADQQGDWTSVQ